jgi:asparagine synthase (glutamine-hydrolysing)
MGLPTPYSHARRSNLFCTATKVAKSSMCGIVALVHLDGTAVDRAVVRRMTATLAHRGPDGQDEWVEGPVGLGHRRLAIFDVSPTGAQPLASATGRNVVVFNGALYDYRERRQALKAEGVAFRGTSDTEVLVNAFEQGGAAAVESFNGMFAFAVLDRKAQMLHLFRDRYGVKPLYIWSDGRRLIAASEIRAILAHPNVTKAPNYAAIREYLTFQNLIRPHSFFAGIDLVPPGSHITVDLASGAVRRRIWWDYDFSRTDERLTFQDAMDETRQRLAIAVSRQTVADVPVGSYLSGGLDSGAISALAAAQLPRLATFTVGFDMSRVSGVEANFDERRHAERTAALLKTRHFETVISARDIEEVVPRLVHHLEDPRLGMSYPNYYAAELASKFVKVALSGAGGDELFGGYPWRYYRVFRSVGRDEFLTSYFDFWQRLIPQDDQNRALSPALAEGRGQDMPPYEIFADVFKANDRLRYDTPEAQIGASLYFEARTFLHGLLVMQDRIAMAHGLEERVPFLDNDLVDFALKVPVRHKLANLETMKRLDENAFAKTRLRFLDTDDGKNVLRRSLQDILPPEALERKKQGFSSPEAAWYRGDAIDYVKARLIDNGGGPLGGLINHTYVQHIFDEHQSGLKNHRLLIWSFLCLSYWVEEFFPELMRMRAA